MGPQRRRQCCPCRVASESVLEYSARWVPSSTLRNPAPRTVRRRSNFAGRKIQIEGAVNDQRRRGNPLELGQIAQGRLTSRRAGPYGSPGPQGLVGPLV